MSAYILGDRTFDHGDRFAPEFQWGRILRGRYLPNIEYLCQKYYSLKNRFAVVNVALL